MKKDALFRTEAELCAAFIPWAEGQGWKAYAETAGWDILLVHADGSQIGVQAKLAFNLKVIAQALPSRWAYDEVGPDYRALLVGGEGYDDLCRALGFGLFAPVRRWAQMHVTTKICFSQQLPHDHYSGGYDQPWHYWNPKKRHPLPEFVPDVVAGSSAPIQLTKWKIGALKIVALLELRGYVTRDDFRDIGIDHRRWTGPGDWLRSDPTMPGRYLRGEGLHFAEQHPMVYQQVKDKVAAEMLKRAA